MGAGTAVAGAGVPVAVDDGPSKGGWDGPGSPPVDHWCAVFSKAVISVTASQRMASRASRPILGPASSITPACPLDGVAWVVSTNTVSWAGGGSSLMQSSARAIAFRHEESPRVPSGRRGRSSAFSEIVLSTRAPVAPSRPPHSFHHDSSREGWRIRNWSRAVRYSSSAVIRSSWLPPAALRPHPDGPDVRRLRGSGRGLPSGRS